MATVNRYVDGVFVDTVETPVSGPAIISATAFQDVCEAAFGGGVTGRARFGAIIRAMKSSNDDEILGIYERLTKSNTFEKVKVLAQFQLLINKSVANVSSQEYTAISNRWPEQ